MQEQKNEAILTIQRVALNNNLPNGVKFSFSFEQAANIYKRSLQLRKESSALLDQNNKTKAAQIEKCYEQQYSKGTDNV